MGKNERNNPPDPQRRTRTRLNRKAGFGSSHRINPELVEGKAAEDMAQREQDAAEHEQGER